MQNAVVPRLMRTKKYLPYSRCWSNLTYGSSILPLYTCKDVWPSINISGLYLHWLICGLFRCIVLTLVLYFTSFCFFWGGGGGWGRYECGWWIRWEGVGWGRGGTLDSSVYACILSALNCYTYAVKVDFLWLSVRDLLFCFCFCFSRQIFTVFTVLTNLSLDN